MSASYYGLILKASSTHQAEEKAQDTLKLLCGAEGFFSGLADNYFDDYDAGMICTPFKPYVVTAKVTSDSAKELINSYLQDTHEYIHECTKYCGSHPQQGTQIVNVNGDHLFLDEKGQVIEPNDSRLNNPDYFIVPVRLHY